MVANGYFLLTGRERLESPSDITAVYFAEQQRAFEEQHKEITRIAEIFVDNNYGGLGVIDVLLIFWIGQEGQCSW